MEICFLIKLDFSEIIYKDLGYIPGVDVFFEPFPVFNSLWIRVGVDDIATQNFNGFFNEITGRILNPTEQKGK